LCTPHKFIRENSYLLNREQFVQIDNFKSSIKKIEKGIAQNSILGPLLFIIYINDIFKLPLKGTLILYADDFINLQ